MRTNPALMKLVGLLVTVAWLDACAIEGTSPLAREPFDAGLPGAPWVPPGTPPSARRVVILHTNDEHSHLLGVGPAALYPYLPGADGQLDPVAIATRLATGADRQTTGGLVRRQYLINKIRSETTDPVLLLSAGDVMMGTIFHLATAEAAPDYLGMALLGYDFATLGNHEFDWGPDTLAASIHTAQNSTFGGAVPILSSNIAFDDVKVGGTGDALRRLSGPGNSGAAIMPWATKTLANGLKVGFLGLTGYEAALVAPSKAPISFSIPKTGAPCTATCATPGLSCVRGYCVNPLDAAGHVAAMAADAQAVVDTLLFQEKVDLVVAITHLGKTEDQALAQLTSGIDVIIGGHSHDEVAPLVVGSAIGSGHTIVVQAGEYGKKLGQLTVQVGVDGAVTHIADRSQLNPIDSRLDAPLYQGTNLAANPPALSGPFERALELTGTVVAPVIAGLNARLEPMIHRKVLDPVVASAHDILGEVPFQDTNLMQLVTDSALSVVARGACLNPAAPIVAVQANGVLRQSLRFAPPALGSVATVADVFGVLPLGASPWEARSVAAPGYPVTLFRLSAAELFAGADVGVTRGLASDSFFLSYSGLRIGFDPQFLPFDPASFDPTSRAPGGRVVKMELGPDSGGKWTTIYQYDPTRPWAQRWTGLNPSTGLVTVISNLYLTGFLDAFGLQPRAEDGTPMSLPSTVLCQTLVAQPDCRAVPAVPAMAPCLSLVGSTLSPNPRWLYPEVKEWGVLLRFLGAMPQVGGVPTIPDSAWWNEGSATPVSPRVGSVTF